MLCFPKIFTTAFLAGSKFSMAALKRFCSDRTLFHKYKIQNISNNTGVIACAIFESKGFPGKFLKFASKTMITQITGKMQV
jgi:uncharacterized protein (DUF2141 family)